MKKSMRRHCQWKIPRALSVAQAKKNTTAAQ